MKKYIIALDQGTTSSRAMVFDHEGNIIASAQKELTQIYPRPGYVEQDPLEIYASQSGVLAEVMAKGDLSPDEIAGIGISQPAGDHHPLGKGHRTPGLQRHCLAMPPYRGDL